MRFLELLTTLAYFTQPHPPRIHSVLHFSPITRSPLCSHFLCLPPQVNIALRVADARRNSISLLGRKHFTQSRMHGWNSSQVPRHAPRACVLLAYCAPR